jgi:hypothetical protein
MWSRLHNYTKLDSFSCGSAIRSQIFLKMYIKLKHCCDIKLGLRQARPVTALYPGLCSFAISGLQLG